MLFILSCVLDPTDGSGCHSLCTYDKRKGLSHTHILLLYQLTSASVEMTADRDQLQHPVSQTYGLYQELGH